jgi:predicted O-linked N-acetylglucosamine transferase (SPINDLY family)
MILAHDHEQFEIFCYSDVLRPDATTARIQASCDVWREVRPLADHELAQQVRNDRIDILVDLTGHIAGNRLLTFARKPAPVQVTYIGYHNTTGLSAMDYRLTDDWSDPPGLTDHLHTERLERLPRAFFCYRPHDEAPEVTPLPAVESGVVTFGSFNSFMKVTPQVISAWLEILDRVTDSRLLVLAYRGGYVEQHLHALAGERGIDPRRIELYDACPTPDYLRLQQRVDIALDPFPLNGHTTTCDSLWMGVPVVMLAGDTHPTRLGGSVLVNMELDDLIARDTSQYVDVAVGLAGDRPRLEKLRRELRPRMAASAVLDFSGFTRNLEAAYHRMWRTWCEVAQSSS